MNQKQAKKLRKVAYGDHSIRGKRQYKENRGDRPVVADCGTVIGYGQIVVIGLRRNYQLSKKVFLKLGKG